MYDVTAFEAPRSRWQDLLQQLFFLSFGRLFLGLFLGLRVRGQRPLPDRGPYVIVANHASHLDTLTLLSLFPVEALRRVRPAAAADYFLRNALIAWCARTFFHILPIVRQRPAEGAAEREESGVHPVDQMIAVLNRGEILVIFPEGTRGPGGELTPFRSGVGRVLESLPDVQVICVGLRNTGRSLPKGAWLPVPFFVDAAIGESFLPHGDAESITIDLQERVEKLRAHRSN